MDRKKLQTLLRRVRDKKTSVGDALEELQAAPPLARLEFATIDHHRELRQGHPEIVYGPGKTPAQAAKIGKEIARRSGRLLVTRVEPAQARALKKALPKCVHHKTARAVSLLPKKHPRRAGILIASAGTADQAVAEHPGIPVAVADTVGSGDAFTAAVADGWLRGLPLETISERANRLGSFVASQPGATPRVPPGFWGANESAPDR